MLAATTLETLTIILAVGSFIIAIPGAYVQVLDVQARRRRLRAADEVLAVGTATGPTESPRTGTADPPAPPGRPTTADRLPPTADLPAPGVTSLPPPTTAGSAGQSSHVPIAAGPAGHVDALEHVSVPRRFLSTFVDVWSVFALVFVLTALISGVDSFDNPDPPAGYWIGMIAAPIGYLALVAWTGRSPGKLLVGGRLVTATAPDGRPGWRGVLHALLGLVLSGCLYVSHWFALTRPDRRTLHDLAAGTRVVRTR